MYEIRQYTNEYRGKEMFKLLKDGSYVSSITDKAIKEIQSRGIDFRDSQAIEKFIKYNNL